MSPASWTHPWAAFADCGIGSDPNATGPCTGGSGPSGSGTGQDASGVAQGAVSQFTDGHGMIVAIGAAILALLAVRVLLWHLRLAAKAKAKAPADIEEDCERCGADAAGEFSGEVLCESCLTDARNDALAGEVASLAPGEGLCFTCGLHYDVDEGGCPVCGSWEEDASEPGSRDDDASSDSHGSAADPVEAADDATEAVDDTRACAICGEHVAEGEGEESMFGPVHAACVAATEAQARLDEIDPDGPDDEETFAGNPRGVGADDEGIRA